MRSAEDDARRGSDTREQCAEIAEENIEITE